LQTAGQRKQRLAGLTAALPGGRADASPERWQELLGVPVDTPKRVSFLLVSSPAFSGIMDLMAGA